MRGWLQAGRHLPFMSAQPQIADLEREYAMQHGRPQSDWPDDNYDTQRGFVAGVIDRAAIWWPARPEAAVSFAASGELREVMLTLLRKQGIEPYIDESPAVLSEQIMVPMAQTQLLLDYYQPRLPVAGWKPNRNGKRMVVDDIVDLIDTTHVIITGGEPILFNLDPLIKAIRERDLRYIAIETSGASDFKGKERPQWITWSPKENLGFDAPEEFKTQVSEVKWVVDDKFELGTAIKTAEWMANHGNEPSFVFMPEGCPPSKESQTKAFAMTLAFERLFGHRLPTRFGTRLQYTLGVR
jgi:organic radical activating enzyme